MTATSEEYMKADRYMNKENFPLVTNIQRMSLHDGPGIRTTVFLKGCRLRCPWCCNPENIEPSRQHYEIKGRKGVYGYFISCDELYTEVMKDKSYYESETVPGEVRSSEYTKTSLEEMPGGITYSGGEPLLQVQKLEPLMLRLASEGIHQTVETSLFANEKQVETALKYAELFYIDIKVLDTAMCSGLLGGDLEIYIRNLDRVFSWRSCRNQKKAIVFRIPVIKGYTDAASNMDRILELICKYRPVKTELIKGHIMGRDKYISIKKEGLKEIIPSDSFMEQYAERLRTQSGIPVQICSV